MAQINKLAVILSVFILLASFAQSSRILTSTGNEAAATVSCSAVHAAQIDETCSSVSQEFELELSSFLSLNPNINCDDIFVGQWLCVNGNVVGN